MVQPINYMGMFPKRDLGARFLEGLKIGGAFGELSQAQQQREAAAELKAQYSTDLTKLLQNPSMKGFNEFALKYPSQREVIKDVAGRFSQEQLDNEFDIGAQVAVSLENQNPDVALNIVEKTIKARKNAGQPTTTYDQLQQILSNTEDPDRVNKAKAITNFSLTLLNPEKFSKVVSTLEAQELRPEKVTEQRAKALKAGVEADFAASEAIKGLALKQAQIDNYAADQDIARQNLKINKLNADLKRAENKLKKEELEQKLADAKVERDDKLQTKVAEANTVLGSVDAALNNADQILANWARTKEGKVDPTKPNSVARSATGTVEARLPTLFQSTQDFESLVASFESKAFLSQVDKMRGLGALTEREGGRLVNALGSLDLKQSPEQLGRNLLEIQRELLKAREQMQRKYGVQSAPDRPAGPGAAAPATGRATQQAVTPGAAPAAMPPRFRVLGRD
jgi:hypothetical protein